MLYVWWCRWKFEKVEDRRGRLLYILEVVICSAVAGAPFSLRHAKPSATFDWPSGHNNSTVAQSLRKSRKLHKPRRLSPSPFFPLSHPSTTLNHATSSNAPNYSHLLLSNTFTTFTSLTPPIYQNATKGRRREEARLQGSRQG
jgi:hypothetical protein